MIRSYSKEIEVVKIKKVTVYDLIAYLEEKIHADEASEQEYGIYLAYHDFGVEVFKYEHNKGIVKRLVREVKDL